MSSRRLGLAVLLVLLCSAGVGTAAGRADVTQQQWQPSTADAARTVRPCPPAAGALAGAVCWSMAEDTSAWMAQPAGSPYPWGQCTYYVGVMRPDIFNNRAPSSVDPVDSWDAWTWAGHGQAEGLAVDGTPRPGDVMVYSRRAAGNDTGHVAIVDAVGGTDPATGDQELTISEMNVEGLDDPSRGQGDTMALDLPRSQLVPGMIQFIHRRVEAQWQTERDPSLAVGLWGDQLATVSQSAAPATVVVTASDASVVKRVSVAANGIATLGLPTGTYRACVSQAGTAAWDAAGGCATASWRGPVRATVSLGRPHRSGRSGRRLAVPVILGPRLPLSLAAGERGVVAEVRVVLQRGVGAGRAGAASSRTIYTRALRLRAGNQVLSLPLGLAAGGNAVLRITVVVRATSQIRVGSAQRAVRLG